MHKGPLLTALERRGIEPKVSRRLEAERVQEARALLERAAELGRLEREQAHVKESILVLSTDIAAARRERDRGKPSELEQWREEARRTREGATRDKGDRGLARDRSKDRDGPDYER